jgi:hypothetical protein
MALGLGQLNLGPQGSGYGRAMVSLGWLVWIPFFLESTAAYMSSLCGAWNAVSTGSFFFHDFYLIPQQPALPLIHSWQHPKVWLPLRLCPRPWKVQCPQLAAQLLCCISVSGLLAFTPTWLCQCFSLSLPMMPRWLLLEIYSHILAESGSLQGLCWVPTGMLMSKPTPALSGQYIPLIRCVCAPGLKPWNVYLTWHSQHHKTIGMHPIVHGTAAAHIDMFQHVYNVFFLVKARHANIDPFPLSCLCVCHLAPVLISIPSHVSAF